MAEKISRLTEQLDKSTRTADTALCMITNSSQHKLCQTLTPVRPIQPQLLWHEKVFSTTNSRAKKVAEKLQLKWQVQKYFFWRFFLWIYN